MNVKNTERKRFYKVFAPMLALFLVPILAVIIIAFALPPVYDGTFLGELSEKYDRLESSEGPKIVIVAGSSAAFGLDSGLISEELGYDVVNFGLYANLGTKLMMDLSKANINEGDIMILAPELNAQTLSLYFNSETAIQALDGNMYMLKDVDSGEYERLIGASWGFAGDKLGYIYSGTLPENAGAYRKENFNEYGDNTFDRPYNILSGYGNAISLDFRTDYTDGVTTDYEEYIDYVNDYVKYVRKKGGEVYFSFPPMNKEALAGVTDEDIEDFYRNLVLSLDCKVISNIYDYILDDGYFYDSEFHLNNSGVTVRTVKLIDDIRREMSSDEVAIPVSELPQPAGKRPDCEDFDLVRLSEGRGWAITGVTEAGREKAYLTIPDEINGIPVTTISEGALSGCGRLVLLTLGKNIGVIEEGAVERVASLGGVIIPQGADPRLISLPELGFGEGCAEGFKLFVSPSDYGAFRASPAFSRYADIISLEESFEYSTDPSGSYAIVVSLTDNGKMRSELSMPAEHDGLPVRMIDMDAFDGAVLLEKLELSKNIREISPYAFAGAKEGLEIHLAAGTPLGELVLPERPSSLGLNEISIFIDWEEYEDYILSDVLPEYRKIVMSDNMYLKLERADDGSFTVIGLSDLGKLQDEITIPDTVSGTPVRTIAADAFADTRFEKLTLGRNVSRLDGWALRGSSVKELIIPEGIGAGGVSVPNNMSESLATDGCDPALRIYVDPELYEEYAGDYFWGDYGRFLEKGYPEE